MKNKWFRAALEIIKLVATFLLGYNVDGLIQYESEFMSSSAESVQQVF